MVKPIKRVIPKPASTDKPEETAPLAEPVPESLTEALTEVERDKFTERASAIIKWMVAHKTPLLVGTLIVAVAITAVAVVRSRSRSSAEAGSATFATGVEAYEEARELRNNPLRMMNEANPAPAAELTPEERKARLQKARDQFEAARKSAGDAPLSRLATLGLAGTTLDLGDAAKAAELYGQVADADHKDPLAKTVALQGRAVALESAGKLGEALDAWKKLEGLDAKTYGLTAGVQVGRLLEAQGKRAEAKAQYEKLQKEHSAALDEFSGRPVKAELEHRLARLGVGA